MGIPKSFHVAMLALVVALLGVDVAECYFLSSVQDHVRTNESPVSKPEFQIAVENSTQGHLRAKDGANPASKVIPPTPVPEEKPKRKSAKYPIINFWDVRLEKVFGKYSESWWGDWKLWVGLAFWFAMWSKWINHGYDEIYYQHALFAFGVNIVILHILQYASTIKFGMLIVCSLLTAQCFAQSYLCHLRKNEEEEEPSHDETLDEFDCDTLYLDLALPIEQIIILFVAQFGVWWFYMTSILNSFDFGNVNYLFWAWAYLVMQMTMIFCRGNDSALGNAFPIYDVNRLARNADKVSFSLPNEGGKPFQMRKANLIMRGVMGYFCNAILREIMAYTIPLMLMGFSEPMDFVVYCVGVNFICTLDDMTERKYELNPLTKDADSAETT